MNINHNLLETDIDSIDIKSPLQHEIQRQEMKESGWRFDKITSMTKYFYKTGEMNGRSYVKIRLRPSAILNIENDDKFCFFWSILATLHSCNNNHPNRVSNYKKYFNKLNNGEFVFTKGFKCSDVHKIEKLNISSKNMFERNFYQDQKIWGHKLIPIEIRKNESDRVIDLLIYKNHYVFIKKLHIIS